MKSSSKTSTSPRLFSRKQNNPKRKKWVSQPQPPSQNGRPAPSNPPANEPSSRRLKSRRSPTVPWILTKIPPLRSQRSEWFPSILCFLLLVRMVNNLLGSRYIDLRRKRIGADLISPCHYDRPGRGSRCRCEFLRWRGEVMLPLVICPWWRRLKINNKCILKHKTKQTISPAVNLEIVCVIDNDISVPSLSTCLILGKYTCRWLPGPCVPPPTRGLPSFPDILLVHQQMATQRNSAWDLGSLDEINTWSGGSCESPPPISTSLSIRSLRSGPVESNGMNYLPLTPTAYT